MVNRLGNLATGENNNARTRSVKIANLRVSKRLPMGEKRRLSFFLEVMNLFNTENIKPSMVNPTTGQPGVDAFLLGELAKQIGSFTTRPEPVSVEDVATNAELSPNPAERLTLAMIRDLNGNGLVEYPETFALRLAVFAFTL